MDPLAVLRTIWLRRWFAMPAIILTIAAALLVYFEGPRTYESSMSYALVNPQVPSNAEIEANPALAHLNSDNPYLRTTDPNLIANVIISRLNTPATVGYLEKKGLGNEYLASPGVGGAGLIVSISASGDTAAQSLATTRELGSMFEVDLKSIQTVNGADHRYLFTSIVVDEADQATEKLSSRIRTVIVVAICGVILIFGAISLGTWVDASRRKREHSRGERKTAPEDDPKEPENPAEKDETEQLDLPDTTEPVGATGPVDSDAPVDVRQ